MSQFKELLGNVQLGSNSSSLSADPGVLGYTVQQTVPAPPHRPVESCGSKRESPVDVGGPVPSGSRLAQPSVSGIASSALGSGVAAPQVVDRSHVTFRAPHPSGTRLDDDDDDDDEDDGESVGGAQAND